MHVTKFVEKNLNLYFFPERYSTVDITSDGTFGWQTMHKSSFKVLAPSGSIIYSVDPGGNILANADLSKYMFNTKPESVQNIQITVINVKQTDGGIYKSVSLSDQNTNTDECLLLMITGKKPVYY